MVKRFKKMFVWLVVIFLVTLCLAIFFSPFTNNSSEKYRTVEASILIDAPVDSVFKFMGNSNYAARWSVYVDHITPLNPDKFIDGTIGSLRRCFCFKDESRRRWDEEILEVEKNKKRRLKIYDLVKFPMVAKGLLTEQLYRKVNDNQTELSLTVFFEDDAPNRWDWFKTKLGAYEIRRIFQGNLENIKKIIESKND